MSPPGSDGVAGLVAAWSMLDRTSAPILWAQVGWWKDYYSGRAVFIQYRDNLNNAYTYTFAPKALGTYTTYQVMSYSGYFDFLVNGTSLGSYGAGVTWTPNEYEFHGETHNYDDQMPGGYSTPETFYGVVYKNNGINWTSVTNTPSASSTIYGTLKAGAGWYEVWDKSCSS